jgi:polyisoprenoid-binding protein YceI
MSSYPADAIDATAITSTRWRIDPARSDVEFQARGLWGMGTVTGRFTRYHGTLDLRAQPAIELTVEGDSIDTRNKRRDKHLRSPDFFGVEAHPYVRFVSEAAVLDGERLTVRGRLHARGASMPLQLEATLRGIGDELEIEAVTEADQHQLGMTWNVLGALRAPTRLRLKGRLVRDEG